MENNNEIYEIELLSSDYWDGDREQFVLYYGDDSVFPSRANIKDSDGVIWHCYLKSVKYHERENQYEVYYKCF